VVYSALRLRLACFVVYSANNVDKVRECHRYIIYIKIVFINNCRPKIIRSYNFLDSVVRLIGNILMTMLMNNEFLKVHNEPKPILLLAWMQRKQQKCKIENLQISKEFCTVSSFMLMICEECSCVYRTNSII